MAGTPCAGIDRVPELRETSMRRREFLKVVSTAGAAVPLVSAGQPGDGRQAEATTCDAFVYGSTPGGIAAAIEAARRGCRVILACPKTHPGGMAASGLSTTDAVRRDIFGGLVREFIEGVRAEYRRTLGESSPDWALIQDGWFYEPSVAERVFGRMLAAAAETDAGGRLDSRRGVHLAAATVAGRRIVRVALDLPDGGRLDLAARTFIDGTYE